MRRYGGNRLNNADNWRFFHRSHAWACDFEELKCQSMEAIKQDLAVQEAAAASFQPGNQQDFGHAKQNPSIQAMKISFCPFPLSQLGCTERR